MKISALATLLWVAVVVHVANAQITINRQAYESARGKTTVTTSFYLDNTSENLPVSSLNSIIEQKGANRTFNFSGIPFPAKPEMVTRSRVNLVGESHPFMDEPSLAEANYATRFEIAGVPDSINWSFFKLEDTRMNLLGSGSVVLSTGAKEYIDFVDQFGNLFEPLPQTYQTEWTEVLEISDGSGFKMITKLFTYIDSWGTLVVPGGRSASALRLRQESSVTLDIPGFPSPPSDTTISSYTYITLDGITASIEVEYDEEGQSYQPISMSYSFEGGAFSSSLGRDQPLLPEGFQLSQNYPNPFNPTTTIDFSLPFTADATIKVYDITGKVVSTVRMPGTVAGNHSVKFDASHLTSGVYLYRLEAGGYSTARLFTLLK